MQNSLAFGTASHPARHAATLACDAGRRVMTSAHLSGVLLSHPTGAFALSPRKVTTGEADFSGIGGVTVRVRGDSTAGNAGRATQELWETQGLLIAQRYLGKCCCDGVPVPIDTPRKDRT